MRYLADILTLTRFILAAVLVVWSCVHGSADGAFIIFLTAQITDIFDGTCARKWPFPKDKTPKYRKYAAQFDMASDVLLAGAQVLFCLLNVNWIAALVVILFYVVVCPTVEIIIYGKFLGHPDNCTKNSLARKNFPLAKKIILIRRYCYTLCLGIINAFLLFATSWSEPVKIGLFIFGCSMFVFCYFFLAVRRKHISRDAVEIEDELAKKAKSQKKK